MMKLSFGNLKLTPFCLLYSFLTISLLVLLREPANSQTLDKVDYLKQRALKKINGATRVAGNGIYEILIEESIDSGVGLYTLRTGPEHPITADSLFKSSQDLLFTGGQERVSGTSYITVRSYTSNTDYVQIDIARPDSQFSVLWLDEIFVGEDDIADPSEFFIPIATTGFQVIYELPGFSNVSDSMRITQRVNVHGER